MDYRNIYEIGWKVTGVIFFIGLWIYAFSEWGFLIGLAIGWLPALIGALIAAYLWPLIVALVIIALLAIGSGDLF
jgi:hypothetical protein